jgi:hypothetical protein
MDVLYESAGGKAKWFLGAKAGLQRGAKQTILSAF